VGTLLASSVIAQASEIAQDDSNVTWLVSQALEWLNDGQRATAIVRPDASISVGTMLLVPGTRQTISGHRLMSVTRNMGTNGVTPGRAIRLVDRGAKDEHDPYWHQAAGASEVREYIYDERTPKEFYVWPPRIDSQILAIEISQSITPANVAAVGDPITIDDNYAPALIEWITYRFFSRDAEETPDLQRAVSHFQNFFAILGQKLQVDLAISPKVRQQLE
jgi:hypothetical protein